MKKFVRKTINKLGFEIYRKDKGLPTSYQQNEFIAPNISIEPTWPLPRVEGISDNEITNSFQRFPYWHYAYEFEGDLQFSSKHNNPISITDVPERPLQRFKHFMPHLLSQFDGTLRGKRVLDIACNSGFWSIQCSLLGAEEVVGFDARSDLIEQAKLIKSITGIDNVHFKTMDFWDMKPENLGGKFDIVLNLGILYHLPNPLTCLELTKYMSNDLILLDTLIHPSEQSFVHYVWEEPFDIRAAATPGIVAVPTKGAIGMLLRHLKFSNWLEIPNKSDCLPEDYLTNIRASWLIKR